VSHFKSEVLKKEGKVRKKSSGNIGPAQKNSKENSGASSDYYSELGGDQMASAQAAQLSLLDIRKNMRSLVLHQKSQIEQRHQR